jgi:hypothetical protein
MFLDVHTVFAACAQMKFHEEKQPANKKRGELLGKQNYGVLVSVYRSFVHSPDYALSVNTTGIHTTATGRACERCCLL